MVDESILDRINAHPFDKMRGDLNSITVQDIFWEEVAANDLIENIKYARKILGPRKGAKGKVFENVDFGGVRFLKLTFTDCFFINCRFIGTQFSQVEFHECHFHNCNMWKSVFDDVYVHVNAFSKCLNNLKHANIGVHLFCLTSDKKLKNFARVYLNIEVVHNFSHWVYRA